jgi:phage-related minor tail protein
VANTVTITVDADTKKAEKNVKGMGTKFKSAMKGVAMAAGGLTLAAGAAAKLGQEYQEATNIIAAGTGASGEQLEGLEQSFKDVWGTVPQDAAEVATGIADVNTELGLEGELLKEATTQFLTASRVMGEDLSPLIKSISDALVGFGEDSENAGYTIDALMAASQAAGVPMTKLANTVVKFGPQLQAMGLDMFDSIALVTNMEAAGLSASKMMPGLNTAIKKLTDEGVTDIAGGLKEMIRDIEEADSKSMALAIATDAFGAGAGVRFVDAIDKGVFSLDEMVATMDDAFGRTMELGEQTLTMSDKFDIMKNKVKLTLAPIGQFATALGPVVIMAPAIATGISAMAASQTIATAATWLQTAAMTALNFAMGPIGLVIIGVALAIAGIVLAIKNWDKITAAFSKAWQVVWDKIKPVMEPITDFIMDTFETIKEIWEGVWATIKSSFETVMGIIESVFNSKFGWLLPGGALLKALFLLRDNWDTIWKGMKGVVKAIANPIIGIINTVIGAVNSLFEALKKVEFGWEEKKKLGITVLPAFQFSPFKNLPTIPTIPTMAAGGIVTSPTLAMLGEAGPEAVIPLGRGGAGGVTINILGPTYGFDDFEERVTEAIQDGVRRGGFGGILATA